MELFKSSLNRNIIYLAFVQGSTYLLPLITFPYLVRVLGPANFGIFGFCQATMLYLTIIIEYGFNLTATSHVAQAGNDKDKITKIFWSVIFSKCFLLIMAVFFLFLLTLFVDEYKRNSNILWAFLPALIGNVIYPVWLFQGKEKMKWLTVSSIISRMTVIPLTFIFVAHSSDIAIAGFIQSLANFLAGIISILIVIKEKWIGKVQLSISEIIASLRHGFYVFISTSAISIYSTGLIIILGFVSGPVSVGYFNAANTIRNALQGLLNPISQAIYPRISSTLLVNHSDGIVLIKKSLKYLSFIGAIFSLTLFLGAPMLIRISVGEGYDNAAIVLMIISPLPLLVSLSNIYGVQVMLTHNFKKQFSTILILAGFLSLFIIFPLASLYHEIGAAITLLLTELFVTLVMFMFVKRNKLLD